MRSVHPAPASFNTVVERCYATAYRALEEGDAHRAMKLFGIMAVLAPRDERAWIGLGTSNEKIGNHERAAGVYHIGASMTGGSGWCEFGRGRALKRLRLAKHAARAFAHAESLTDDPSLLDAIEQERSEP
ncbi:MAG: hypothetical protein MUF54_11040 [Polyangiaceae bacterium]|nr:hypothetical protein [Polyangiaceae bacterium]